jgi:hypothetical protein
VPAKGFRKSQRVTFISTEQAPLDKAAKFQVYREGELAIAPGEMIRITRNGFTLDRKHALNNGMVFRVRGFTPGGDIALTNGWTIGKDYGFLTAGYTLTSFSAQGKSPDRVLIAQSADSFPASSREQFYVSASRGRESCTVYTSDTQELRKAITRADTRLSATAFMKQQVKPSEAPPRSQPTRRDRLMNHVAFMQRLATMARRVVHRQVEKFREAVQEIIHER